MPKNLYEKMKFLKLLFLKIRTGLVVSFIKNRLCILSNALCLKMDSTEFRRISQNKKRGERFGINNIFAVLCFCEIIKYLILRFASQCITDNIFRRTCRTINSRRYMVYKCRILHDRSTCCFASMPLSARNESFIIVTL